MKRDNENEQIKYLEKKTQISWIVCWSVAN